MSEPLHESSVYTVERDTDVDHTPDPRHADYGVDYKRSRDNGDGYWWRCRFCGWQGFGLSSEGAAHREATTHLERERA